MCVNDYIWKKITTEFHYFACCRHQHCKAYNTYFLNLYHNGNFAVSIRLAFLLWHQNCILLAQINISTRPFRKNLVFFSHFFPASHVPFGKITCGYKHMIKDKFSDISFLLKYSFKLINYLSYGPKMTFVCPLVRMLYSIVFR